MRCTWLSTQSKRETEPTQPISGRVTMTDEELEDDEDRHILGFIETRWDCPYCDYINHEEGDRSCEVVECENCQEKFKIRMVV